MNVDRCTKNILFDEKIGGTIHLALGASYPETVGEVRVYGEPFCRDGEFLV